MKQYPGCNWGLACGIDSGVFVLDFDGAEGESAIREISERHGDDWTRTLSVKTVRGAHFYFQYPVGAATRNSVSKLAKGLDVRGEGGYAVVPPSVHPSGAIYRWAGTGEDAPIMPAPAWLLEMLTALAQPMSQTPEVGGDIPEGQRNATLAKLAGVMRRRGMTEHEIEPALLAVNTNRCVPPLPEEDVKRIAQSIAKYEPAAPATLCVYASGRFQRADTGIVYSKDEAEGKGEGGEKAPLWVCAPLKVLAMTRDSKSGEWGRLLEWKECSKGLPQLRKRAGQSGGKRKRRARFDFLGPPLSHSEAPS